MNCKDNIRNFSIIAHIDHGKSTLSDRIIEMTNGVSKREMKDQILDSMDIERERGITIKLNAVQLKYFSPVKNREYIFNLIDTPGHVDFTYEVSRSLAACEGAVLVIDASQGIQAQTLSNLYLALENNLEIIPVINKVDLPTADVDFVKKQIEDIIGIDASKCPLISAKTGKNITDVLEQIIDFIPPPQTNDSLNLKALIFDSYYDIYRGVVCLIRVFQGQIKIGQKIKFLSNKSTYIVSEIGVSTPKIINLDSLESGYVGWFCAQIKNIKDVNVGDTIVNDDTTDLLPLPGYKKILPMVFCGLYPIDTNHFNALKDAMSKISLSDSSLIYEYESSQALGFGIRCGFLGLLHMDVIKERIVREFNIPLISSAPSVIYRVYKTDGITLEIDSPAKLPDPTFIKEIHEPYVKLSLITPSEYIGNCIELCNNHRGHYLELISVDNRQKLIYEMPLSEIIYNFFDKLKSISKGYATMDYELIGFRKENLCKVDILINKVKVDALSTIQYKPNAPSRARVICQKLKENIPRHLFEVPIQASIGGKIIARETISAMRKNVLSKCYGGDITRKKKLLEEQKKGKKKLKSIGNVDIPQEVFIKVFNDD